MSVKIIFFDLGDTLGQAVLSPPPVHLVDFDVFPFVGDLLTRLRARGLRLGIISNTGSDSGAHVDSILARAGILDHFDPALRIYSQDIGLNKDSPQIFLAAAARAGEEHEPASCLFVGEDVAERAHAAAAGLQVCPHPLLSESIIEAVIADEARPVDQARRADVILRYVRISSDGAALPWSSLAVLALSPFDWVDIVDTVDFHWRLLPNLLYPNRPMPNSITNQDGNQCSGPRKMPD